jgi:hypothetical protein
LDLPLFTTLMLSSFSLSFSLSLFFFGHRFFGLGSFKNVTQEMMDFGVLRIFSLKGAVVVHFSGANLAAPPEARPCFGEAAWILRFPLFSSIAFTVTLVQLYLLVGLWGYTWSIGGSISFPFLSFFFLLFLFPFVPRE